MTAAMKLAVFGALLALSWAADETSESDRDKKEVYGAGGVDSGYYNPYYNRYNAESRYPYDQRYTGYPGYTDPRYNNYNNNADPRYYNNNVGAYYDPRYSGAAAAVAPISPAAAAAYPGYYNNRYTPGRYTGDKYSAGYYDPAYQGYNAAYRQPYTGYPGYYPGAYPAVPAAAAAAIAPYRKV